MKRDWCVQGSLGNLVWKEFKESLKRSGQRGRQRAFLKVLFYCEGDGEPLQDAQL